MASKNRKHRGRGEGGISGPRKDGLFVVSFSLGVVNGKRKRKTFYAQTHPEAVEILKREQGRLGLNLEVVADLTVATYLDQWLNSKKSNIRENTYNGYKFKLDHGVVPLIGGLKISKLNVLSIRRWLAEMPGSQAFKAATIKTLYSALDQAVRDGVLIANPILRLNPQEIPRTPEHQPEVWTAEQLNRLIEQGEGFAKSRGRGSLRLYAAFVLASHGGMRFGEILGMRWEDIDFKAGPHGVIYLKHQLLQVGSVVKGLAELKTKRSKRAIALTPVLRGVLLRHRESLMAMGRGGEEFLFLDRDRKFYNQNSAREIFYTFCRRLGLPKIKVHEARHTHATHLLQSGANPKVLAGRMGHSVDMLMSTYAHVLDGADAEMAAKFDDVVSSSGSTGGLDGVENAKSSGSSPRET